MRRIFSSFKSPPMVVAFIALLAALCGTAVALPGSNTVTTGDIKGGAVRTSDIKNNNVRGKDIRTSTLRGSDVGANTLTGSDINEGSLGPVQVASTANTANTAGFATVAGNAAAVGGEVVDRLDTQVATSSSATVYSRNGLTLRLVCDGSGTATLNATTSVQNSDLYYWGYDTDNLDGSATGITGEDQEDGAFDIGDTIDITAAVGDADADTAIGQIEYFHPTGVSGGVSIHYVVNSFAPPSPDDDDCQISGVATG